MTYLRQRMLEDMQLRGLAESTQEGYLRAVRQLAAYYNKSPDKISEEELRQYFLYLTNEKKAALSTYKIALYGLKFFYEHTLGHEWPAFELIKPPKEKKLPVVLSRQEVQKILDCLYKFTYQVCLTTIYSCGLRLGEALRLEVSDVDRDRMQLRIRQGKGNKDRYVPLPVATLPLLGTYWRMHHHPSLLFPSENTEDENKAISPSSVQRAFKSALGDSGVQKPATPRTLRHSYATHLLEEGVSLQVIKTYLGHHSIKTTTIYTHLTKPIKDDAFRKINGLMSDVIGPKEDVPW